MRMPERNEAGHTTGPYGPGWWITVAILVIVFLDLLVDIGVIGIH